MAGVLYVDANNNGTYDGRQARHPSSTLFPYTTLFRSHAVTATATTDANGAYSFTGLRPGTYTLTETQRAGEQNGELQTRTPGGSRAHDVLSNIVLGSGTTGANNNFGELSPASNAGFVY